MNSDEVLFGNLMTMLLGGEDTTAFTLTWAVHHLCDNASSVEALRREADAVLGAQTVPADIETANALACAGAVANETMRLRPVGPLILHESNGETVLGDVRVPARTRIFVLTRPAALDPAHFDDPDSFRPERWLRPTGVHAPSAHIPFGSGPRLCPGRTLATLYKNFDVERIGDARGVREVFAFVMSPLGLKVRLRRRSVRPS